MATTRRLLEAGAPPLQDNFGPAVAARWSSDHSTFSRGRMLLEEGVAGSVDDVDELYAAGVPRGLEGGLALVATNHRAELMARVQRARELKALAVACADRRGRVAKLPKLQGERRKRGEYDRSTREAKRARLMVLTPPVCPPREQEASPIADSGRVPAASPVPGSTSEPNDSVEETEQRAEAVVVAEARVEIEAEAEAEVQAGAVEQEDVSGEVVQDSADVFDEGSHEESHEGSFDDDYRDMLVEEETDEEVGEAHEADTLGTDTGDQVNARWALNLI